MAHIRTHIVNVKGFSINDTNIFRYEVKLLDDDERQVYMFSNLQIFPSKGWDAIQKEAPSGNIRYLNVTNRELAYPSSEDEKGWFWITEATGSYQHA